MGEAFDNPTMAGCAIGTCIKSMTVQLPRQGGPSSTTLTVVEQPNDLMAVSWTASTS